MKKKGMLLLALVAAAALSAGVLSACKEEHEHTLTHVDAVAATCTETGAVEYWYCTECGKNFGDAEATQPITQVKTEALGHAYGEWEVVEPATCTEDGLQKQTCTRCGDVVEQPMKAPGHSYSEWTEQYPPTCTETGLETRTCSRCGAVGERDIPALGHNFVNMTCTRCGASQMSDKLEFKRNADGSYTVAGIGTETEKEIYIPNAYQGSPVTAIADHAFYGNDDITGVYFNGGVVTIGENAFGHCTALKNLQLSDSITSIGDTAFYNTAVTSVAIPASVAEVGTNAFGHCFELTSLTTPRTNAAYQTIDGDLYTKDGTVLIQYAIGKESAEFSIPEGVVTVKHEAFSNARLSRISVPASVKVIEDGAFRYLVMSLLEIDVDDSNTVYRSRSGNLYTADGATLLQYAAGKADKTFALPDDVKYIADGAFHLAVELEEVTFSASLISIGEGAFRGCRSLVSAALPEKLESIGAEAFSGCTSLKEIALSASVNAIGANAFTGCTALSSAVFEETEGWTAGGRSLAADSLSNAATAAVYLTDAYVADEWTRG